MLTNDALKEETFGIIYIPDVIQNKKLHFYRWPQLGAYLAVPVVFQSCLNEEAFDSAVANRVEY